MYIDEYISQHPYLLPEGQDLMKFSLKCEEYLDYCNDLVPYNSPNYVEQVINMCIGLATDDLLGNDELKMICEWHDKLLAEGKIDN